MAGAALTAARRRAYEILDVGMAGDAASRLVHRALVGLVLASVAAAVLESVPALQQRYGLLFTTVEVIAAAIFTIEYGLRLWAAPEHKPYAAMTDRRARLAFACSLSSVIDLLAVLPLYLAFFSTDDLRMFLLLRIVRFLKLLRYSPGARSLLDAISHERRALFACLMIFSSLLLMTAAVMHIVEHTAQPDKFGSIPDAMYWAVITLTTVGYGDVVPVTPAGKIVAGITALLGLVMLSLPVGIVATAFAQEIRKRDFVVTWAMVARVPLFTGLGPSDVAEIMQILNSQMADPGEVVVRRGEPATCMYFVASGEVEVEIPEEPVRLGEGQFFGEAAVLGRAERTANVRATTKTKLLVLEADDLRILMSRQPEIARRVKQEAYRRVAAERIGPHGDLITEELQQRAADGLQ